jgi:nucleotide-binding universal stress UspA family protein
MFRSILCPVDFSAPSRTALRCAAGLAEASGGRVTALFVNDPLLGTAAAAAAYDTAAMARATDAELKKFVQQGLKGARLPAGSIRFAVTLGKAAPQIVKAARDLKADLIVMGTHGLGGASRLLLGSTTEHVLRKAGVPVLAIPPGATGSLRAARGRRRSAAG